MLNKLGQLNGARPCQFSWENEYNFLVDKKTHLAKVYLHNKVILLKMSALFDASNKTEKQIRKLKSVVLFLGSVWCEKL